MARVPCVKTTLPRLLYMFTCAPGSIRAHLSGSQPVTVCTCRVSSEAPASPICPGSPSQVKWMPSSMLGFVNFTCRSGRLKLVFVVFCHLSLLVFLILFPSRTPLLYFSPPLPSLTHRILSLIYSPTFPYPYRTIHFPCLCM